jgi:hypothetical protein
VTIVMDAIISNMKIMRSQEDAWDLQGEGKEGKIGPPFPRPCV